MVVSSRKSRTLFDKPRPYGQKYPNQHSRYWFSIPNLCCTENALAEVREMKIQVDKKEQREVCYYILAYLADNPDAGDTFDGIVEWWLLDQRIKFETRNVSEAVSQLVSEGLIVEHAEADSRIIYRVNRSRDRAIRSILTNGKTSSQN